MSTNAPYVAAREELLAAALQYCRQACVAWQQDREHAQELVEMAAALLGLKDEEEELTQTS